MEKKLADLCGMSLASMKPRRSWLRSSISSESRRSMDGSGRAFQNGLVGPPGTGKTLLAKAVAGDMAVPFFSISGCQSLSRCSSAWVRPVCATCSSRPAGQEPAIIFIDELDALGRARGVGGPHRQPRRARADPQPAAHGDGRFRQLGRADHPPPPTAPEILDQALQRRSLRPSDCWWTVPTRRSPGYPRRSMSKITLAHGADLGTGGGADHRLLPAPIWPIS